MPPKLRDRALPHPIRIYPRWGNTYLVYILRATPTGLNNISIGVMPAAPEMFVPTLRDRALPYPISIYPRWGNTYFVYILRATPNGVK